jgi:hypothetical protein
MIADEHVIAERRRALEHQRSSKKVSSALALQAHRQYITALFGKNKVS